MSQDKTTDYMKAIYSGIDLYDMIETELSVLSRINDFYTKVSYEKGTLSVDAEDRRKGICAKTEIKKEEIFQKVITENLEPKDAICKLLKEKICLASYEKEAY